MFTVINEVCRLSTAQCCGKVLRADGAVHHPRLYQAVPVMTLYHSAAPPGFFYIPVPYGFVQTRQSCEGKEADVRNVWHLQPQRKWFHNETLNEFLFVHRLKILSGDEKCGR